MRISEFPHDLVNRLKIAYTVRNVDPAAPGLTLVDGCAPRPGNILAARVDAIGHHNWLELGSGRKSVIYPGDELLLAFGERYAPDQYEAVVPADLTAVDLVAAGGVAGKVTGRHADMAPPTALEAIGLLADREGVPLDLRRYSVLNPFGLGAHPPVITVVGTSMNAGKSTTAASVIRGLNRSGHRVGGIKVTGTGAGGDPWMFRDSGAAVAADFTDGGYATTAGVPIPELAELAQTLYHHAAAREVDAVVMEIADGILQTETSALLEYPVLRELVDGVVLAAADAAGARYGAYHLRGLGLPVIAASGRLTQSALAVREAAAGMDAPVYTPAELAQPEVAMSLLHLAGARRNRRAGVLEVGEAA
ncbi:DUF1611 domain-containing protein [Glycomyces tenuis]|uniref:DUF1611 domain-containing protein n=1 Tax=Glycomyces tenuis TaxID=58116 RepID=UPI00040897EB|nr:DUF1611 domain-containing protein [Glycomyces tenuis]